MEKREKICSICGKSKEPNKSGRVSQFISACVCSVEESSESDKAPISICADCGKKIDSGRVGSMTQYVLRAELCHCNVPNPRTIPESLDVSDSPKPVFSGYIENIEELREELDIAEGAFPASRYEPIRLLGSGASGNVYLARDQLLKKNVAVKVLQVLTNEQLVSFQEEAKTTSKLDHPSIINILDFGATESGTPFMALEYFKGSTLLEHIKTHGPLDWQTAKDIFIQICDALYYAHGQSIFHRDLKPGNILLNLEDGENIQVRLIDFGLAKVSELTGNTTEFQGKTLVGTPYYMSPDVVQGFEYTEKSEIYSLGCILFEALSGRPPFLGESALETLSFHAKEKAPLISSVCDQDILPAVESLIDKCLIKLPDKRFSSAENLGRAIADAKYTSTTEPNNKELFSKEAVTEIEIDIEVNPQNSRLKSTWLVVFACLAVIPVLFLVKIVFFNSNFLDQSKSSQRKDNDGKDSPYIFADPKTIKVLPQLEDRVFKEASYVISENITDEEQANLDIPKETTALSIKSKFITGAGFYTLTDHKLQLLELDCPMLNDAGAKIIAKISSIEEIDVYDPKNLTAKGYKDLCSSPNFSRIHVKYTTLPAGAIAGISKNPNIRSVIFSECKFSDQTDFGSLANIQNLSYLRLSYSEVSSEGYKQLAKVKNLVYLSIAGVSLDAKDCAALSNISIPQIRFSDCTISDDAFIKLAKIRNLKALNLIKHSGTTALCYAKFRKLRPDVQLDSNAESTTVKQLRKDFALEKKLRQNERIWSPD